MKRPHLSTTPPRAAAILLAAALVLAAAVSPRPAAAQKPDDPNAYAKIMIHIVPVGSVSGRPCTSSRSNPKCDGMVVAGKLNEPYYAYVVVTDADREVGIAGLQFGIDYDGARNRGVDLLEWNLCATLQFPYPAASWPSPGTGNLITWDRTTVCQRNEPGGTGTGVVAVAGYFYLSAYTADRLSVTVRPVDSYAKVADCDVNESIVEGSGVHFAKSHLGYVEFSDNAETPGYNPCGQVKPVTNTTWGAVKSGER